MRPLPTDREANRFQNALMALQIVKPVPSGYIFQGTAFGNGQVAVNHTERRPPMFAGDWAGMRRFDVQLMDQSRAILPKLLTRMETGSAKEKNSVILAAARVGTFPPADQGPIRRYGFGGAPRQ
jgi:hypothetical protein